MDTILEVSMAITGALDDESLSVNLSALFNTLDATIECGYEEVCDVEAYHRDILRNLELLKESVLQNYQERRRMDA